MKLAFSFKYFLAGIIIILVLNYSTFYQAKNGSSTSSTAETNSTVELGSIKNSIEVSGVAELVDEQSLSFNKAGTVTMVNFKAGDTIKKGDIIAELDSADAYNSIDDAKLNLENAKLNLTQLYDGPDKSQILQSENSVTTAQNSLNTATKELENLKISQQNSLDSMLKNIETSKKDLETSKTNLELSKNELETTKKQQENSLNNTITTKSTTIQNLEDSFKTNLVDIEKIIEEADYIMGVTDENKDKNNAFEDYLSAKNTSYKTSAESSLLESISMYTNLKKSLANYDYSGDKALIKNLLNQYLATYNKLYETTDYVYKAADNSIVSVGSLTQTQIDSMKSNMSSYRSSSLSKINSINNSIASLDTLTDTDLISESNSNSIAQKEASIKASEVSIEKQEISISNAEKSYNETKASYAVTLDSKEKDLISKEKSVEIAKLNLEELLKGPTEENVKKAQNSIKQAEIKLESANKSLDDYKLEAPFDGVVRKIDYMVGDNITNTNDSGKYVYIENPNLLEITVMLDQIDITKVKLNGDAIIVFDAYSDIQAKAVVSSIDTEPVQNSGVVSYEVKLVLDDETFDKKILSGMTANVEIIIESKENILTVKSSVITDEDGKNYVNLMKNGQTVKTEVVTGISANGLTEIVSGLNEGDEVATEEFKVSSTSTTTTSSLFSPGGTKSSSSSSSRSSSNGEFGPPGGF
nr:HlyD family efflux transporter periplasmic adaptor subunit [Candidatus Gracilibacteria bacterium]